MDAAPPLLILSVGLFFVTSLALGPASAASLPCIDAETGDSSSVDPVTLRKEMKALKRSLKKRGVHLLDLDPLVHEHRRRLGSALERKDWCEAQAQFAGLAEGAEGAEVTGDSVSAKFTRVQDWLEAGRWPKPLQKKVKKLLEKAAKQTNKGKHDAANATLNKALGKLFKLASSWDVPERLPAKEERVTDVQAVAGDEVSEACPSLAKKERASGADVRSKLEQLERLMNKRKVRVSDVKGGRGLLEDYEKSQKLRAFWPAASSVCALIYRVENLPINLGFVTKRFSYIQDLRETQSMDEDTEGEFRVLVREATGYLGEQEFEKAHGVLEKVLIMLGEPKKPGGDLK